MARKKKYDEGEVIEKAMEVFWQNGYEMTSVRMLEKAMGINQFSIYSSFKNKEGVFLESIKCYRSKLGRVVDKLRASTKGIEAIKEYFYDFVAFSTDNNICKGCLINNTMNELGQKATPEMNSEMMPMLNKVSTAFTEKLALDTNKSAERIAKEVNFLLISVQGLNVASKVFDQERLDNFIEIVFENI